MESEKFKRLNQLKLEKVAKKNERKIGIGQALTHARKQAKLKETKTKPDTFFFKGETQSLPSKVPKAELPRSPLQLSRMSRNMEKCGYTCRSEPYVHSSNAYNPFDTYAIQNMGTLETFLNICCAHARDSGCSGKVQFISPHPDDMPQTFRGTLFSVHTAQCSDCGTKFQLESDYFEAKPEASNKLACFSRVSQVAGIASKNMSWVVSEMQMFLLF